MQHDADIEKARKRSVENRSHEFLSGNQAGFARMQEEYVVKILRLWIKDNGFQEDLHIYVDPTASSRYWLVPTWGLEKWKRDMKNVYHYPLEES
jgi:hypothetical protein